MKNRLNYLLKKRQRLESQIVAAERLEKRRAQVILALEKSGLIDRLVSFSDDDLSRFVSLSSGLLDDHFGRRGEVRHV